MKIIHRNRQKSLRNTPAKTLRSYGIVLCLLLTLNFPGRAAAPLDTNTFQVRALWVTRWDYRTKNDIAQIMENARWAGFNHVFFQVRGNATVFYTSLYEPRAQELGSENPEWDPLAYAVAQAHLNQLKIHAWVNIFPGWRGTKLPQNPRQILLTHPEWFLNHSKSSPPKLNSHYVWLNPVLPGVQKHLKDIVLELADHYNLDGIHFDYFRYPGPGDFSADSASGALKQRFPFSHATEAGWDSFRRDRISDFLETCRSELLQKNPRLILSAAIIGDILLGRRVFFQDSQKWVYKNWLDWVVPMTYTADTLQFRHWLVNFSDYPRASVIPGLMVKSESVFLEELTLLKQFHFKGFSFFSYSTLFPGQSPNALAYYFHDYFLNDPAEMPVPLNRPSGNFPYPESISFRNGGFPLVSKQKPIVTFDEPVKKRADAFFLKWSYTPDPHELYADLLDSISGQPVQLRSQHVIPLSQISENLTVQILARPHDAQPQKLLRSFHFPVTSNLSHFRFLSFWGKPVQGARRIFIDQEKQTWVPAGAKIVVFDSTGNETPFSPITRGLNAAGHSLSLKSCLGITQNELGEIVVTGFNGGGHLFVFDEKAGTPLPGVDLNFFPGDIAVDSLKHFFILEAENSRWHVLDSAGNELAGSPVNGSHRSYGIAVTPDGQSVFVSCRSDGKVHHWVGDISEGEARYRKLQDFPVRDAGFGTVFWKKPNELFVCEPGPGYIAVWDTGRYRLKEIIHSAFLRAPRAIAPIPGTNDFLILETSGQTPARLVKFRRE